MSRVAAFAVAVAVAVAMLSGSARADKTTLAVVPFTGPQAQRGEAVVVRTLRKKAQLIPATTWRKSAAKLFANTHSPEDIAAVADDVGAKIVITGVVKRDGRTWQLSVSVRDGSDGKARARLKYPLKGPRLPPPTLALLGKEVGEAFDTVLNGGGAAEETPPPKPPKPTGKPPKTLAQEPPLTTSTSESPLPPTTNPPPPATTATVTPTPAPGKEEELAPVMTPPPKSLTLPEKRRPRWAPWFDANAGLSISGRQFDFDTTQPPHFTSGVVTGIFGDVTVYPLAFTWNKAAGVFSGLGVGGLVSKPFWPDSNSKTDNTQHFSTAEFKVEGGLRWRIVLYKPIPRPELLLQAGGGEHTFSLGKDPTTGMDVGPPDVAYKYLTFAAGFRLHFAEWAALTAIFNYHFVLASGPISNITTEYGPTATVGLRFGGNLDFMIYKGLKLGLMGYYERFNLTFVPGTTMPAKMAGAAVDQYFGGVITVGYVL